MADQWQQWELLEEINRLIAEHPQNVPGLQVFGVPRGAMYQTGFDFEPKQPDRTAVIEDCHRRAIKNLRARQ